MGETGEGDRQYPSQLQSPTHSNQQQHQQGHSNNTLDVLGRIYAKSQAALDRAVSAFGGGGGTAASAGADSTPGSPSGRRAAAGAGAGQGLGSPLGPGASPRASGAAGVRARRSSAVLPDGSSPAAPHSFSGASDIAQLAAATPAGFGGIQIRVPRGRRASSVDYASAAAAAAAAAGHGAPHSPGVGGVGSLGGPGGLGAALSPGRMAATSGLGHSSGSRGRGTTDAAGPIPIPGATSEPGESLSDSFAIGRSDSVSPGVSGSLPKILVGSLGAGSGSRSGSFTGATGGGGGGAAAAVGGSSPNTSSKSRASSLLIPGARAGSPGGLGSPSGPGSPGGAADPGAGQAPSEGEDTGAGSMGSRLGRKSANLQSPRTSAVVADSGGSFSLPRIMAVKGG